jgi:hypothetical protein
VRGFIELLPRGFFVAAVQFNFQIFAHVNGFDALVTHLFERALYGFALRINDRFLWRNNDFGFHLQIQNGIPRRRVNSMLGNQTMIVKSEIGEQVIKAAGGNAALLESE